METKFELEILCDGAQPLTGEGYPIYNRIPISAIDNKKLYVTIKQQALKYLHYFMRCKIYNISNEKFISGKIWKIDVDNKNYLLANMQSGILDLSGNQMYKLCLSKECINTLFTYFS
jgi:hypothetical protein